ncbi:hypothetical protein B0H66DRAFT_538940 [Apodospora peruviana]|uniref:Uncharacterized protein n=1 Tax=Apodospora peruviana TaxID=516989 RepID=A0AAE0HSE2_9PEZI|nr:hypothetical protein B0H66DRAFT_538940 [Apodospora peruviana]
MANSPDRPRRRFAPIPIETTFERYRKTIPAGELTPSPSPRSPSPPPREKRRFAPQLVESSVRRSRRAGDEGPATKPTDKTDITPYTNHIYAPKARKRYGHGVIPAIPLRQKGHARRESCDDEIAGGVFDLVARDAQRKLQEVAMSAFPNSGTRIGGAEHFYVREGSEDDSEPTRGRATTRGPWAVTSRRNSSEEDISWAFKEMQEHAQLLGRDRPYHGRIDTLDLDNMSIDSPPSDAMGLTRAARESLSSSPLWISHRPSSHRDSSLGPIGEVHMPLLRPESPLPAIGESTMPYIPPPELPPIRPIGESYMPYIPSAPPGKAGNMGYAPPISHNIPPETSFGHHEPFRPFPVERDMSLERARNLHRLRAKGSPPMLGQDLTFRMCPSPKQTKLEPDHLWDLEKGGTMEEANRDPSEQRGLWRGYCFAAEGNNEKIIPANRPQMIATPAPLKSPKNPFEAEFGTAPILMTEEPSPTDGATRAASIPIPGHPEQRSPEKLHPEHRSRNPHEPKGLHMLHGLQNLDERLKAEQAAVERDEKIAAEFDDKFVTQVYNYLSLGYPALARQYDEELSKISRIPIETLEKDDLAIMENLWGEHNEHGADADAKKCNGSANGNGSKALMHVQSNEKKVGATGHIMLDSEEKENTKEEDRCPRWKALKLYIFEWARQHPDLNAISPLAWGVGERRGSWGI